MDKQLVRLSREPPPSPKKFKADVLAHISFPEPIGPYYIYNK